MQKKKVNTTDPVRLELQLYKDDPKVKAVCRILNGDYTQITEIELAYKGNGLHTGTYVFSEPGDYTAQYVVVDDNKDPDGYETVAETFEAAEETIEPKYVSGVVTSKTSKYTIGVIKNVT